MLYLDHLKIDSKTSQATSGHVLNCTAEILASVENWHVATNIGFIGLGVMGGPMAGHLVKAGRNVTVWGRNQDRVQAVVNQGATSVGTLAELAAACDAICLCVTRTEDVQQCLNELLGFARSGTIFIDHSTISPKGSRLMHDKATSAGMKFVDAPITGGSMGAKNGTLTVFLGGAEEDCSNAQVVIEPYTRRSARVGGPGAGQLMKMVNQIAVAGSLLGLCESMAYAQKAGLDLAQTRELVGSGAAGSWAYENYGLKIINEDWTPGFSVDNQIKDFEYVIESAKELNAPAPMTRLCDCLLEKMSQAGHGSLTTAALYKEMAEAGFDE